MTVWIPLLGGTSDSRKKPAVSGWALIDYRGIDPASWTTGWVGMRLDHYVVIDCDSGEAKEAWLKYIDKPLQHTWVRKTPRGWHFIYRRMVNSYAVQSGPLISVAPNIDVKAGMGAYIVYYAPGYDNWPGSSDLDLLAFNPAWVPEKHQQEWSGDEWSEMPEGIGDNSMISFAGTFRRWGMDQATIARCLQAINEIVMTEDPMPFQSIKRLARQAAKYTPEDTRSVICPKCGTEVEYL